MKNRALDEALRRRAAADRFTVSPGLEAAMLRAAGQAALAQNARRRLGRLIAAGLLTSLLLVALPSPSGRADALQHLGSVRACQPAVMLI
mgnify:CR=1 FL=1